MEPKVLHVIARMNVGGTANYISTLLDNMPNNLLATGYTQEKEIEQKGIEKFKPYRIDSLGRKISLKHDFRAYFSLRKIIRETKPDIVHSHTFKAGLICRLQIGKFKKVHTFHGHLFDDSSFSNFQVFFIKFIESLLAKKTDLLISVGEKVGKDLRNFNIGSKKEWVSIPPGIEPLKLIDKQIARKQLGIPLDGVVFGWLARMTPVKNPKLFLSAAKKMPKIHFAMAGGGDSLAEIKSIAPENVKILGWIDAAIFWSAIDVAVSTSENEGMPIALIEAQMAGKPVIATNVGSTSEVIQDKLTGFLFEAQTEEVSEILSYLIVHQPLIKTMGAEANKRALNLFSIQNLTQNHKNAYAKVLK